MSEDMINADAVETATAMQNAEKTTGEERDMYMGPNLLKDGLQQYQVYIGGIPEYAVEKIISKYSLIRQLFAPLNKINEYEMAVNTPGTPQYIAYQQIIDGGNK